MQTLSLPPALLDRLERAPNAPVHGKLGGVGFIAKIAIPDYENKINAHFAGAAKMKVRELAGLFEIPFAFKHFGLIIAFDTPVELHMHDEDMHLDDDVRDLVAQFGPVIVRNAYLTSESRDRAHKNIFPSLRFHYDRGRNMENQFSLFTRNPFDADQKDPRKSSTLFLANIVAHMQCMKEEGCRSPDEKGLRPNYDIFLGENVPDLIGDILVDQPWAEPAGTGEIAIIDNMTVLHASWHRRAGDRGWRIGARYLF